MNTVVEPIYAVLSTTPVRWQPLVSMLPLDLLSREPAPGEWSALNCLQHLLVVERQVFPVRFRAILAGESFVDFDPLKRYADVDALTPAQLAAAFAQLRQESLVQLQQVTDDDVQRTALHPKQGTVTLAELLNTWAAHDLNHTVQAERALMQPFMNDCGPWRHFFRDHEVAVPEK